MANFSNHDIVITKEKSKISKEKKTKMNTIICLNYLKSERQDKALYVKQDFSFAYIFFNRVKTEIVVEF